MNWKNRLTNYNFWISIFSAVLLILQALKIEFDIAYVNEIFTAVLGLLVVIGIINDPTRTTIKSINETKQVLKVIPEQTEIVEDEKNIQQENVNVQEIKSAEIQEEIKQNDKTINLPIVEKNEADDKLNQNGDETVLEETNFKTIIDKISTDLDNKIKQLENYNKEMAIKNEQIQAQLESKLIQVKNEMSEVEIQPNIEAKEEEQPVTPAAAETDCSYLNIIN